MDLKVGDVVILKSNSPHMTVEEIEKETVYCKWFVAAPWELKEGKFKAEMLERVKK
jgi:uncharacterized protein YodC (DUF2158 family)